VSPRVVGVDEAVAAIPDGATLAADGFSMMGVAEAVLEGIERAHDRGGHPRDLTVVHSAGQSNRRDGLEHLAVEGLTGRVIGSHWGMMPRMSGFLGGEGAEAVCLPQGQMTGLFRAIAAGRPGNLSRIGLNTFVDPRVEGGKVNRRAREGAPDYVELIRLGGEEYLLYRSFPIDVALIRVTSIDADGNGAQEEEAVRLDALAIAQAAHNSGGTVICQAKRLVERGSIPPRDVVVPGCLIDLIVLAPEPDRQHRQTDRATFDPVYVTPAPAAGGAGAGEAPPFGSRMVIGRRAVRMLDGGGLINVGTGIPGDTVGPALAEAGVEGAVLTVESGVYGGTPAGGVDFGIAAHPTAIISHASQFDFYNGGGLDVSLMGAGQVDGQGNVNVSRLAGRVIGCGGFIDITQATPRVCFLFSLEGRHPKFVDRVDQLTFSAEAARRTGQEVFYITERAVFQLGAAGLRLIEVAPGLDVRADLVERLPFGVEVADPLAVMPEEIFQPAPAPPPP
jgi:propionate CoA-transferase